MSRPRGGQAVEETAFRAAGRAGAEALWQRRALGCWTTSWGQGWGVWAVSFRRERQGP